MAYDKEYYELHKNKMKESKKKYYEKNRERIIMKTKENRKKKSDEIKATNKKYYELHKDKFKEYNRKYNEAKRSIIIECECGSKVKALSYYRHCNTKKHNNYNTNIPDSKEV